VSRHSHGVTHSFSPHAFVVWIALALCATILAPAAHAGNIAVFNMDTDPGWTVDSGWAFGTPIGGGGSSGNPDSTSGNTGTNVYGYNLSGDYANDITPTKYLTTTADDLFQLNDDEFLTSSAFGTLLGQLEAAMQGGALTVFMDACGAGSFANDIGGTDRMLVMSTSAGETAQFIDSVDGLWAFP
jgi:hypothetical protein